MAAAGNSGPVMVQEKSAAPVVDLPTASAESRALDAKSQSKKSNMSSAPPPKTSPKTSSDEHEFDNVSLYEEILDDVEQFEYSKDSKHRLLSLPCYRCRD